MTDRLDWMIEKRTRERELHKTNPGIHNSSKMTLKELLREAHLSGNYTDEPFAVWYEAKGQELCNEYKVSQIQPIREAIDKYINSIDQVMLGMLPIDLTTLENSPQDDVAVWEGSGKIDDTPYTAEEMHP